MQPRQSQGIGVEHSQRGEYCIGHAEVQRGSSSGGRQQGQQEQHDHDDLRGEPYMEEQHEVRHQQKVEFRARIERPAGRKMEPKPLVNRVLTSVAMHTITKYRVLTSVAMHTITKYRAANTPMVMRSETSSLPDLAGLLSWSEVSAGVFGAVTMFSVSYALTIFLSPI